MQPEQHARDVVHAYREGERLPPAARDAAWARLTASIDRQGVDEVDGVDGVDAVEGVDAGVVRRGKRSRWLAVGAVLLAAAAVLLVVDGLRRKAGREAEGVGDHQAVHEVPAPALEPVRTVRPLAIEAPVITQPPVVTSPGPTNREPSRSSPPPAEDAALGAELALLRAARAALAKAAPQEALQRLAEHERRFPGGLLAEERMVLRVQALCESGAVEEARAAARRFTQERPNSPHAGSLAGGCGE